MAGGAVERAGRRRLAYALVVAVLSLAAIEAFSWAALSLTSGRPLGRAALAAEQARRLAGERAPGGVGAEARGEPIRSAHVLHPFLGYVMDPALVRPDAARLGIDRLSLELGFPRNTAPVLQPAAPEKAVIAIFGGSVADLFAAAGAPALRAALAAHEPFRGREIVVLSLAAPGYKQPQQLMALNYLLALGAHFDAVVNIDGVNEVALPPTELIPLGVAPFYPRGWFARASELAPALRVAVGRVAFWEELRRAAAARARAAPWRWSWTAGLVWSLADRFAAARIAAGEQALLAAPAGARDDQAQGPALPRFARGEDLYAGIAEIWQRSSLQMHHLCRGRGIAYRHLLQPSQYVAGSKPMGDAERRIAWREDSPFREPVERGYPLLRAAGAELAAWGVSFVDLTDLFAGVAEPVYADDCCHLDARGNERLAAAVARALLSAPAPIPLSPGGAVQ